MQALELNKNIMVNNLTVSYTNEGPEGAPVVIFIHGFPLNKSMWNEQTEALKANYRVIAYDIRGHGNSEAGPDFFSIEQFVGDLIGFMDALQIKSAVLCGLSLGGYIALNAIVNYPQRFDALVLCDTNCVADTPEVKEKRMQAIENIHNYGVEKYAEESIEKLFAPQSLENQKDRVAEVKKMIIKTSVTTLTRTLTALTHRKETCSRLPEIPVSVLILVGKEDTITPPSVAKQLHEGIKDSTLNIIENAGHLSNLENTDEFNKSLIEFVSKVYQKAGV